MCNISLNQVLGCHFFFSSDQFSPCSLQHWWLLFLFFYSFYSIGYCFFLLMSNFYRKCVKRLLFLILSNHRCLVLAFELCFFSLSSVIIIQMRGSGAPPNGKFVDQKNTEIIEFCLKGCRYSRKKQNNPSREEKKIGGNEH